MTPDEATLDALLNNEHGKWQRFYADRAKPCPFFGLLPDENLAAWIEQGQVMPGRALDIGCGNARNAIFLARHGFEVDAVDYSKTAIAWAHEAVTAAAVPVALHCRSVFELDVKPASRDFVYDSGCFHHIAPHRRQRYVELVTQALKPGGAFGLVCFAPEGGSGYADYDVYRMQSLGGGLGYDEAALRAIWSGGLRIESLRRMVEQPPGSGRFGLARLWVMLARKPG